MIFGENGGMTPSHGDGGPEPGRGMSGVAANHPSLSAIGYNESMVARVCIFATTGHEPRQARKGAAVATLSRAPKSC